MTSDSVPSALHMYERHGAAWARLRNQNLLEEAWIDRFCALLSPRATVLDIGCVAGVPIGAELVRRGYALTGMYGSATMVALFRRNLTEIQIHHQDMRTLELRQRFSGLLAWDSFFHLTPADQRPMFARFADHTAPGGPLMFTSGYEEGSAMGKLEGDPLYHGSLNTREYEALLNVSGFEVMNHVIADPTCGSRTIWFGETTGVS